MNETKPEKKLDLRVVKTREAIQAAFEHLLETTDYPDITVTAIAREARVSRKTFYAHYSSTDDLLRNMALDVAGKMSIEIQPEGELLDIEEWFTSFTRRILSTLRKNPHLNGNVARCVPISSILEMLREPLLNLGAEELRKRGFVMAPGHDYYLSFYLGGLNTVYETWLTSGQNDAALDEMACFIARTATRGIGELIMEEQTLALSKESARAADGRELP